MNNNSKIENEQDDDGVCDTTILVDEVEEALENGGGEEFNFSAALALRKNLCSQFEKHASTRNDEIVPSGKVGGVKSKIAQLEMKSRGETGSNDDKPWLKSAGAAKKAMTRPPKIPTSGTLPGRNNCSSCLSVYLRIRPPVARGADSTADESNTVEIIDPGEGTGARPTTIRAYPPPESNAAKVLRSLIQQNESSNNINRTSGGSVEEEKGIKEFEFSEVFGPNASQLDVYNGVAAPLVEGLFPYYDDINKSDKKILGQSALLFSYGITNAGKTYTIMGDVGSEGPNTQDSTADGLSENRGIMPRALHDILTRIDAFENQNYQLNMSYFEIYNEQVYDLLKDKKTSGGSSALNRRPSHQLLHGSVPLKLRESRDGKHIIVKGLQKHRVSTVAQGLELANLAKKKRHTSSNNINSDSSRSHCICQLEVAVHDGVGDDVQSVSDMSGYGTDDEEMQTKGKELCSVKFWIVDLAGSERSKRTGTLTKSVRQKEAALINSSLMKLTRCLQTLRENQLSSSSTSVNVPFRESKLTHLFMNHLTGASSSRTTMIVNINPSASDFDETQHVLAYATVARNVIISETEYNQKRNAIAAKNLQHTHGDNGRQLRIRKPKSPPRKIAKLASKLSPRSMLAKRREQQEAKAQKHVHKRKAEVQSTRTASSVDSSSTIGASKKLKGVRNNGNPGCQVKSNPPDHLSIESLRLALAEEKEKTVKLQSEVLLLKAEAADRATVEAEIRIEVSQEMEEQMNSMREQYNMMINRMKMQIKSQPTPGKSCRKVKLDRAEEHIEELLEKVDECEDEMERMRSIHAKEIENLKRSLKETIAAKDSKITSIENSHAAEIEMLESELEKFRNENQELKALLEDEEDDGDGSSSEEEDASPHSDDEVLSPTPKLRRLCRERCSEVACSNVASPIKEFQSSSKKKTGIRILRSKPVSAECKSTELRQPLSSVENMSHLVEILSPGSGAAPFSEKTSTNDDDTEFRRCKLFN